MDQGTISTEWKWTLTEEHFFSMDQGSNVYPVEFQNCNRAVTVTESHFSCGSLTMTVSFLAMLSASHHCILGGVGKGQITCLFS